MHKAFIVMSINIVRSNPFIYLMWSKHYRCFTNYKQTNKSPRPGYVLCVLCTSDAQSVILQVICILIAKYS